MKSQYLIIFLLLALLTSCLPSVNYTSSGGVRLNSPSIYWLKYKRKRFDNGQRVKIDSRCIYETTEYNVNDSSDTWTSIARFFPDGQVLFFSESGNHVPFEDQVNDPLAGTPGYYAVKGNKLKFQSYVNIFGNQLPETYGIILNDSTLKIYNTHIPDCRGLNSIGITTYECLEKKKNYSIWKKTDKYKLREYKPDW